MVKHAIKRKYKNGRLWFGLVLLFASIFVSFFVEEKNRNFEKNLSIEKTSDIGLDEKIIINFPIPVSRSSVEGGFSITPRQKVFFAWENNNRKLIISAQNSWRVQTSYSLQINHGRNILLGNFNKTFDFTTRELPKVVSFLPLSGEKDFAVDIEDPIRVTFNRPLDEYNVKFVVNPDEIMDWEMSDDKRQIRLLPKNDFKWNTKYIVSVFLKEKKQKSEDYVKVGDTFFSTSREPEPELWDKNPVTRAQQAKRFTQPKISEGKYIDINISKQMMVIFENGEALEAFVVSTGKRGMETPKGSFKIENKTNRAWSAKYSLWMPNWMAILPSGEVGIHELPIWPGGYQEGANHLGIPVSHGCIRLGPGSAKRVHDWAEIGTPVIIY